MYWIEKIGTFKNGYNATAGGDGKKYLDYDLIINTYKELQSASKVSKRLGIDAGYISKILKNNNIQMVEPSMAIKIALSKRVAKCDLITKEILQIYQSIT